MHLLNVQTISQYAAKCSRWVSIISYSITYFTCNDKSILPLFVLLVAAVISSVVMDETAFTITSTTNRQIRLKHDHEQTNLPTVSIVTADSSRTIDLR